MNEMMLLGVPLVVIVPAVVEVAKRAGLPTRWAGLAAMLTASCLVALADLAGLVLVGEGDLATRAARWVIAGVVYGLAGAGVYSQVRRVSASDAY